MRFEDRAAAGRQLASLLGHLHVLDPVVIALPRGGLPVGYEIAQTLGAPLDVLVARKIGAPREPELGVGAIAEGGALFLNRRLIGELKVSRAYLEQAASSEMAEIDRQVRVYRGDRSPLDVRERAVIAVDDGLATGATMLAALRALERRHASRIIVAVPVCAADVTGAVRELADELVCPLITPDLFAIGQFYRDFRPVSDEVVLDLLTRAHWMPAGVAWSQPHAPGGPEPPGGTTS